jgi:3-oxoadipate enol-lactonase
MTETCTIAASDGVRLSIGLDGIAAAPALLMLHSIGCRGAMWSPQVAQLAARHRVVTLDLRGHGASDAPDGDYDLERLARDAIEVLDALDVAQADVCGLSLGGLVAQQLALQAPGRVRRLVLAATAPKIGTAEAWRERAALVRAQGLGAVAEMALGRFFSAAFRAAEPDTVSQVRDGLLATSPTGYAGCCGALRDADLTGDAGAIQAPTLVIAGRQDVSTPPAQGEALAASIDGARYLELDAAHLCNLEQPDAFTAAVADFLEVE